MNYKYSRETILEALSYIPVADLHYSDWIRVGMALKEEGFDCAIYDSWSYNDSRYHPGECAKKWHSFKGGGSKYAAVSGGTIILMAQQYGFRPTPAAMDFNDMITT